MIKALSFDCYGTLIDWETGILVALAPWQVCFDVESEALLAAFARHESAVEAERPDHLYPQVLEEVMRRLGKEFDAEVSEDEARAFGVSVGNWPAFPDTAAALASLKQHFQLTILSNVDRASFARSNLHLGVEFDLVCTAEDIGSYKPAQENFAYLLARLKERGIGPGELLHVAQSLYHDHAPALAMGLETAWIDRRAGKSGGGATLAANLDLRISNRFESMAELAAAYSAGQD
ncbi:MAG TPA: haloacid dehalogenase type II [Alphaproteobacteria bacterium]|jgi:2-haloalkanoic acid dehalogenase type II|nr:haloacid dehalogenase type II [Alphaproteobacteria bacterium]